MPNATALPSPPPQPREPDTHLIPNSLFPLSLVPFLSLRHSSIAGFQDLSTSELATFVVLLIQDIERAFPDVEPDKSKLPPLVEKVIACIEKDADKDYVVEALRMEGLARKLSLWQFDLLREGVRVAGEVWKEEEKEDAKDEVGKVEVIVKQEETGATGL